IALEASGNPVTDRLQRREKPALGRKRHQRVIDRVFNVAPFALVRLVPNAETINRMAFIATAADILEEEKLARTCVHQLVFCNRRELNGRAGIAEQFSNDRAYPPANFEKAQLIQILPCRQFCAEESFEEIA